MKFAPLLAFLLILATAPVPGSAQPKFATKELPTSEAMFAEDTVSFGIYDPKRAFSEARDVELEHVYVFWQALDLDAFRQQLAYAQDRERAMMVTVEPYTRAVNWRDGGDRLFSDIVAGDFQREIRTICTELSNFEGRILVRWGHEMEDPNGRYPWARHDSEGYKAAYRHFVADCRRHAPKAVFVWSPKGERNLADYYPGPDSVDLVGVSLYGLERMDVEYYGGRRDFVSTLTEKYARVAQFGKPVMIAELGVSGSQAYRDTWFESLFDVIEDGGHPFSLLRSIVYFNDKEPYHWPFGLGSPDWRIAPTSGWFARAEVANNS